MRKLTIGVRLAIVCVLCLLGAGALAQDSSPAARSCQVTVTADGKSRALPTSAPTVADLLAVLGIALGPLDETDPSPDTPISDGLHIAVTRVTCRDLTEDVPLPPKTIVLADLDRAAGFTEILAHGQHGLLRRVSRLLEKDGQVTSRTIVSEQLLSQPQDAVVLRGARGLPTRGGDWRSWRTPLLMEATAYDPGPRSCGKYAHGHTATGIKAEKGVVAVDDRVIPMGAHLYIPGYGFALAADRGSAIKGMRIDLCFATYDEAIRFGRRRIKVYLLD
jgi:3D (Asp-Asp-Asp) domain-containing protein